jgi:hypothetical protein
MAHESDLCRLHRLSKLLDHEDDDCVDDVDIQIPGPKVGVYVGQNVDDNEDMENGYFDTDTCVECCHQLSEVFCEQCHDHFCLLCYGGQHRKGKRKLHTYQPILRETTPSTNTTQV